MDLAVLSKSCLKLTLAFGPLIGPDDPLEGGLDRVPSLALLAVAADDLQQFVDDAVEAIDPKHPTKGLAVLISQLAVPILESALRPGRSR